LRIAPLLALAVFAATAVSARLPVTPVGNWYGEGQPGEGNVIWLSHHWPDGRWDIRGRWCKGGKVLREEFDSGHWQYTKGAELIVTTKVDGQPAHDENHYRTVSYDGRKHVYRHLESGFVFSSVRVDEKFELPSCAMVG